MAIVGRIYSGRAGSICIVRKSTDAAVLIWKAREIVGNQSERETRGAAQQYGIRIVAFEEMV